MSYKKEIVLFLYLPFMVAECRVINCVLEL